MLYVPAPRLAESVALCYFGFELCDEISKMENQNLCDWYLARLRRLAWLKASQEKPTPMTLVKTDKQVLQDLVSRSTDNYLVRQDKFLEAIKKQSTGAEIRLAMIGILGLGLLILACVF